jgi:hypothetical protein
MVAVITNVVKTELLCLRKYFLPLQAIGAPAVMVQSASITAPLVCVDTAPHLRMRRTIKSRRWLKLAQLVVTPDPLPIISTPEP